LLAKRQLQPTHHLRPSHRLRKQACSHRFPSDPSPVAAAAGCEQRCVRWTAFAPCGSSYRPVHTPMPPVGASLLAKRQLQPTHHLRPSHRLRKQACSHRFPSDPSPVAAAAGCEQRCVRWTAFAPCGSSYRSVHTPMPPVGASLLAKRQLQPTHHLRPSHRLRKQACSHRFCCGPSLKPKAGSPALTGAR